MYTKRERKEKINDEVRKISYRVMRVSRKRKRKIKQKVKKNIC